MRRWDINIQINLKEVGCGDMDCIEQAQVMERWWVLLKAVTKLRVPLNAGNSLTGGKSVTLSKLNLFHRVSKYISQPADIPLVS